jgi:hypothetical protein
MPTVLTWANEILEGAPLSVRASKQAALQGLGYPLDVALNMNYTEVLRTAITPPVWRGESSTLTLEVACT